MTVALIKVSLASGRARLAFANMFFLSVLKIFIYNIYVCMYMYFFFLLLVKYILNAASLNRTISFQIVCLSMSASES